MTTSVEDLEEMLHCNVDQWHTLTKINLSDKNINYLPDEVGKWQNCQSW